MPGSASRSCKHTHSSRIYHSVVNTSGAQSSFSLTSSLIRMRPQPQRHAVPTEISIIPIASPFQPCAQIWSSIDSGAAHHATRQRGTGVGASPAGGPGGRHPE
jgi:hypothetical protein